MGIFRPRSMLVSKPSLFGVLFIDPNHFSIRYATYHVQGLEPVLLLVVYKLYGKVSIPWKVLQTTGKKIHRQLK